MAKHVLGYIRVSSKKQEEGVSLPEQRDAISRYAERSGLTISDWFEETKTAAKRGRPEFTKMLRLLRHGKADGVIIHKIDRSARNLRDWADLGEMIDAGIDVHFANETLDLHTRGGRLSADIQAVVAADYIRNLREETRKGFYGRLKQGRYPWPAPIGYRDMGKGKLKEPHPIQAPLVRRAFELYATGAWNLDTLRDEMHRRGLRNKRGTRMSRNGLSRVLNNPFYIGLIRVRQDRATYPGHHQPLISKSLFDRVKAILTGKMNTKTLRHEFLFRRLLACGGCGRSLTGEIQKGRVYYRCHTRTCRGTTAREDIADDAVRALLRSLVLTDEEQMYLASRVAERATQSADDRTRDIQAAKLRLGQLTDRLGRLTDAYIDRMIERELFEERKTALLHEQKSVEEELQRLEDASEKPDQVAIFFELAKTAYLSYELADTAEKRELLEILTSNRVVDRKTLELRLRIPFQEVANRIQNTFNGIDRYRLRTFWDTLLPKLRGLIAADPILADRLSGKAA